MEIDKTPAFDISANDLSLTKSKKKKKKDKNIDIGEKQAETSFRIEPSEKPAQVNLFIKMLIEKFVDNNENSPYLLLRTVFLTKFEFHYVIISY